MEFVYGVEFSEGYPDLYELLEYHDALNTFAEFLASTYEGEASDNEDMYQFFQEVMGDMVFKLVNFNLDDHRDWLMREDKNQEGESCGEPAQCTDGCIYTVPKAVTEGNVITVFISDTWEYKCENGSLLRHSGGLGQMTAENLVHELFHSLDSFAGSGDYDNPGSPGYVGEFWLWAEQIMAEAGFERINPGSTVSEVLADFGLFLTQHPEYLSETFQGQTIGDIYQTAIGQSISYNNPVSAEERAEQLGVDPDAILQGQIGGTLTIGENARVRLIPDSDKSLTVVSNGTSIQMLGRAENGEGTWIYIANPNGSGFGWISSDFVEGDCDNLPELNADGLNGLNPFPK